MAAPPRSTAGRSLKAPLNLPIGVRAPATITDRAVTGPCYLRSATPKLMFPWSVVTLMALLGFALRSALHVLVKGPPVRLKCQIGSAFKFPAFEQVWEHGAVQGIGFYFGGYRRRHAHQRLLRLLPQTVNSGLRARSGHDLPLARLTEENTP